MLCLVCIFQFSVFGGDLCSRQCFGCTKVHKLLHPYSGKGSFDQNMTINNKKKCLYPKEVSKRGVEEKEKYIVWFEKGRDWWFDPKITFLGRICPENMILLLCYLDGVAPMVTDPSR